MEEKVPSCPSSFYIPIGPLRGAWKKKQLSKYSAGPHRPWKCHSTALLFPLFLSLTHFPHLSLSFSLLSSCSPSFCPCFSLPSFCMPSSCLSSVPELFKTLSPLLLFFFNPTRQVNCTNLKTGGWKLYLQLICIERIYLCSCLSSYSPSLLWVFSRLNFLTVKLQISF